MPTIRDNKFKIVLYVLEMYSLLGGEFYVKDHAITSGQPTDVQNGVTLYTDNKGEFNFRVGRKKSDAVAEWFNRQCDTSRCTTFGHPAGGLNFAFLGTLRLRVSSKSKKEYTVIFDDILIAQGRSGATNNWWFGGKNCFKSGDNVVESRGFTENNDGFKFRFARGNGEINSVVVSNMNYLTWMNNINGDKLLSQINIPGTHDSGTYNFNTLIVRDYVKTQGMTIRQQLDRGIRYLDIRCRHVNDAFQIYHGDYYVNLNFDEVLDQCISFLNEAESESIVLLVSEENHPTGTSRPFYKTFLSYVSRTSEYWYRGTQIPSLKDARKKLFLMYRFNFEQDSFGINCNNWSDNAKFEIKRSSYTVAVQDEYDVSTGNKEQSIKEMVTLSKERKPQYLYLNYISLAPSISRGTILATAGNTNPVINKIVKTERNSFLGMVIMDYPEMIKELISDIFDNNDYL